MSPFRKRPVSGPTLMWLADCGTYLLIMAQIGPVPLAVTTNLNMTLSPSERGRSRPDRAGRVPKLGKRLAVSEFSIFSDDTADPIAQATLTYSILRCRLDLGYYFTTDKKTKLYRPFRSVSQRVA